MMRTEQAFFSAEILKNSINALDGSGIHMIAATSAGEDEEERILNTVLIDLRNDTVTAEQLVAGCTAHDASGEIITGTHIWNVKHYTDNFSPEEFRCECSGRCCTGYPTYMKPHQLMHIQKIRNIYGKPMIITCGMRCRGYNAKLNGSVANSKHLTGRATDLYMQGVTETLAQRKKAVRAIKKLANHTYTYGDGINSYGGYVSAPYMGNALHTDTK